MNRPHRIRTLCLEFISFQNDGRYCVHELGCWSKFFVSGTFDTLALARQRAARELRANKWHHRLLYRAARAA